jgi:uncharacterized protein (TIGR00297 family)
MMAPALLPSEDGRQLAHMAAGSAALLLRYSTWWEAAIVLGVALAFNVYGLPRLAGGRLLRAGEPRRVHSGVVLYPLSIVLLVLALPGRLDIVAAAWGILAFGDGMATIVGRRWPHPRLPWNPDKSVTGSLAFVVFGAAAGSFLCWWCRPALIPPPYLWFSLGAPIAAAVVAAAVETLPMRLNDNLTVPVAAAGTLWWMSLFSVDMLAATAATAAAVLPAALALNGVAALAGYAARAVTSAGAVVGALIGVTVFISAGWAGWVLLFCTLGLAVLASRAGLRRKELLGIAEDPGGRRSAGSAIANTGVGAAAAVLATTSYLEADALIAFVAALAAAGGDTVASEIGKAWGRRTWTLTPLRRVRPGTPGAVSLEGTAAGLAGALCLTFVAVSMGLVAAETLVPISVAATAGGLVEGVLSNLFEGQRILNNDVLNFLNTLAAVAVAVALTG